MKDFVPYEQSLELKELGFDEPCIGNYFHTKELKIYGGDVLRIKNSDMGTVTAPTFSQAFRWFRDLHELYHRLWPEFYRNGINFNWQILWYLPKDKWTMYVISDGTMQYGDNGEYSNQEEAELACLNKLIEIVKTK
jgi:hypothetical protein